MNEVKRYTKEQIEFIRSIAKGKPIKEITKEFNELFKSDRKQGSIRYIMSKHGIKNGLRGNPETAFKKGHVSWNNGMKGLQIGGKETQFKRGSKPITEKPDGTERFWNGWWQIKSGNEWIYKHRFIWEQAYGEIPPNHVILFKDNDKNNVTLDNLFMTTMQAKTSVAIRKLRSQYEPLNIAEHKLAELRIKVNYMEEVTINAR
ncbi:HNH endonuclease [Marinilactibacillus psychrotolerans]|uniref:HNH endonuclease n=1 Tax=Marinilactibacillus psychrotolerans TaxID=191770 RepID=A0A5R9C417_9LACT|nr:HNH endonuclease signature motif containing protein [Marinilactibacillus psychrotolerans]TLQ07581.1 HNH endonuclease [Marinilactibacillus psychrotolerans]